MTKVLPLRTEPPAVAIERRHSPRLGPYRTYRDCLRWDFGFSCAFCLLHERDLDELGSGELGLFTVEHRVPQDEEPSRADEYSNCYWSCVRCNVARQKTPIRGPDGARLLDPCANAWAEHFRTAGDHLEPIPGDADAAYTAGAYRIDAPLKVEARAQRRRILRRALRCLERVPPLLDQALGAAASAVPEERTGAIERAAVFQEALGAAREAVLRYGPEPPTKPDACRCRTGGPKTLPTWLESQLCEVPPASRSAGGGR